MPKTVETSREQLYAWGTARPYNAYSDWLKTRYGGRLQKVSVDAGFTCPNRDGVKAHGGCTYCNNASFVPPYCKPGMSIAEQTRSGIAFLKERYGARQFVVYFQAYSNTYAPLAYLKCLYTEALTQPGVRGLVIGTRPDCVDAEKIDYFTELAKTHYISLEYGLESPYDDTLARLNRGHTYQEWVDAVRMTAGRGIHIGAHLILGLPGESSQQMLQTAEIVSRQPVQSLKLHHLHVVKDTVMAAEYRKAPFKLFAYREYINLVIEFLRRLRPDIQIQRLVGDTYPEMLLAPNWGIRTVEVVQNIETVMLRRGAYQGELYSAVQ